MTPAEEKVIAVQLRAIDIDVAAVDIHFTTEGGESFEVEVDRAGADDTATRDRDACFAQPCDHRPEKADRGAHFTNEVVRSDVADLFRLKGPVAVPIRIHLRADMAQYFCHEADVAEVGDALDVACLLGEEGGGENR